MPNTPIQPFVHRDDKVDLRELTMTLWQAKYAILAIMLVVTLIGASYAFLSTPIYEAEGQTLPPPASALIGYNASQHLLDVAQAAATKSDTGENTTNTNHTTPPLTMDTAYGVFLQRLESQDLLRRFFYKTYLPAHPEAKSQVDRQNLWEKLNKILVIELPKKDPSQNQVIVTIQGQDPRQVADWTNLYLRMASDDARRQLLDKLSTSAHAEIQGVQDQIAALRTAAKTNRQDEIARVESALQLAQAIQLTDPPSSGNLITSYTGNTLYLRGSKALEAELSLLKKRQSDDPYITQLPNLLYAQQLLQRVNSDPKDLTAVTIDQHAEIPVKPIWPRKALIIAIAIVLGLILAIFFVLLRQAWRRA
jgi:chain length determinant protein (polysaccharide antigen chain regulator)